MDWLTFISHTLVGVAWPTAVLAIALVLRRPLTDLLPFVQKLKYRELEVEFAQRAKEVRAEINEQLPEQQTLGAVAQPQTEGPLTALATVSPRAAVLEAWRLVEQAALAAARRLGGSAFRNQTITFEAIRFLERHEGVDRRVVSVLRDLRGMRNQAAHAPEFALSKDSALEYARSTEAVVAYLQSLGVVPNQASQLTPAGV